MNFLIVTTRRKGQALYGIDRAILGIEEALKNNGHEVTVFDGTNWDLADENKIAQYTHRFNRFFNFLGQPDAPAFAFAERLFHARGAIEMVLNHDKITHIWFQDSVIAFFYIIRLNKFLTRKRPKIIISQHSSSGSATALRMEGFLLPKNILSIWKNVERWTLRRAKLVVSPSEYSLKCLLSDLNYQEKPSNFIVFPHGRPSMNQFQKVEARNALGWIDGNIYILVLGRIDTIKRIDLILHACLIAERRLKNIQVVLVGGNLTSRLQAIASQLYRQPIVFQPREPELLLAAADIYISACSVESYGMANVEAMAASLPCIVAAGGAALEILEKGAWHVAPTANSMAEAIIKISCDNDCAAYWRKMAKSRYLELPTWHDVAMTLENYLNRDV